jgi:prepilin-type N-terminal cleavage/methylation domain-containing protein
MRIASRHPIGFTLIELLIVVAIIAILAAIAVPNFLEAQTRAKASRARSDLRTIATGLEAYRVDHNNYPPNNGIKSITPRLTTPVAFLSTLAYYDPFRNNDTDPVYGELIRYYTYQKICDIAEWQTDYVNGGPPADEAVDAFGYNLGAFEKYGKWRMVSYGPDRRYSDMSAFASDAPLYGSDILYDATNGTVSWGNILRTQKSPEGKR